MWPGERAAVIRLREATGAPIQDCHMAWVLYDGDMDEAVEQIRVTGTRERMRAPYKPRQTTHFETLCQQWRDRFGADWPVRPGHEPPAPIPTETEEARPVATSEIKTVIEADTWPEAITAAVAQYWPDTPRGHQIVGARLDVRRIVSDDDSCPTPTPERQYVSFSVTYEPARAGKE